MIRFLNAGESHGPALTAIVEGMPAGVPVDREYIDRLLRLRQGGYGRGGRMKIEKDSVEILAGIRGGMTTGAPVSLVIRNRDWENWRETMSPDAENFHRSREIFCPRPGHTDLAGGMKYSHRDLRNILERSSARETASRTAAGALAACLLREFGIETGARVVGVGSVSASPAEDYRQEEIWNCPFYCGDPVAAELMKEEVDRLRTAGDTVGGTVEIRVKNMIPGLGSHVHWDRKLDGRLAGALMSVQAVKAVETGCGVRASREPGSMIQDEIVHDGRRYRRRTNNAGGIEGGISNGEDIVLRIHMKPIPTLMQPLRTVDIRSREEADASVERSDACAVPALAVVALSVVSWVICEAFLEKFPGDCLEDIRSSFENYLERIERY